MLRESLCYVSLNTYVLLFKDGYIFSINNCTKVTASGTDRITSYTITAVPQTVGKTGDSGYDQQRQHQIRPRGPHELLTAGAMSGGILFRRAQFWAPRCSALAFALNRVCRLCRTRARRSPSARSPLHQLHSLRAGFSESYEGLGIMLAGSLQYYPFTYMQQHKSLSTG